MGELLKGGGKKERKGEKKGKIKGGERKRERKKGKRKELCVYVYNLRGRKKEVDRG